MSPQEVDGGAPLISLSLRKLTQTVHSFERSRMVAGGSTNKTLPLRNPGDVHLTLTPCGPASIEEQLDFPNLHNSFRPFCLPPQPSKAPCRVVRQPADHRSYYVCLTCSCNKPLHFAVRSTRKNIMDFHNLLAEGGFQMLCPSCA